MNKFFYKNFPIKYTIVTRNSSLAIFQAKYIKKKLHKLYPFFKFIIKSINTKIKKNINKNFLKINRKKNFVKKLEKLIIKKKADLAIHCLKDVPINLSSFFKISVFLKREDPRDVFISNFYNSLNDLPNGSIIGTNSIRRQILIMKNFPKLIIKPITGNIETRLKKLDNKEYDALILALAGLKRLKLFKRIKKIIKIKYFLPCPGQGTLVIEILKNRKDLDFILSPLNHKNSNLNSIAERTLSRIFFSNCQIPLSSLAIIKNNLMKIKAMIGTPNGKYIINAKINGSAIFPKKISKKIAFLLKKKGIKNILNLYK
ncbi:hydroxymethylbilane synthase [Candidatus Zinderia endosymbiont of Aphrophora alni]|uniref:hydroxymethylbilane synthase n=1 Tax=Candidatus Zinderia endosymbiont of Aphrophora alni TaxID=3077951 RepID=UPI0030D3D034